MIPTLLDDSEGFKTSVEKVTVGCCGNSERIRIGSPQVPGWLSQLSVQLLILAQVMISQFMGLNPTLGSALTAWDSLSLSLSAPPLLVHTPLSLSKEISLKKKKEVEPGDTTELPQSYNKTLIDEELLLMDA